MKNFKIILLALITVISNGFLAHFFAPAGIMLTPVILVIASSLIVFGVTDLNSIVKSLFLFFLVVLHDVSIKLYAGGSHDQEGLGLIHLFLFLGLLPSFIVLLITVLRNEKETPLHKITAVILFPILMYIYLHLYSNLGLGRSYPL